MAERTYSVTEIEQGLPQFHQKLREETGYTGQFRAEPTTADRFQYYMIDNPGLQSQVDTLTAQFNAGNFAETDSDTTPTTTTDTTTTPQAIDFSPVTTQLTPIQTGVTGLEGDVGTLQSDVTDLTGDVGTVQEGVTGLETAVGTPGAGQTDLFAGQQGLMGALGAPAEGQTDLFAGQQGLMSDIGQVQQAVGAPAEGDPRTLFAGQGALATGQDRLGQRIGGGVDRLTGEITNVGADLTALQRASDAYQREAQRQRSLAAQAGQTGREQLERQVAGVGQQTNRVAEAQAAQRLAATPRGMMQMATGVAPTAGPQLAAQTAQAAQQGFRPPAQGVPAPVSPLGPQAQDPRDLVTQLQKLQAQQAGLMAQLGI
jgi:hypothetical protein